jgi:hypothetical protein
VALYANPNYTVASDPEIYNWDPVHTRTFYITDYYN